MSATNHSTFTDPRDGRSYKTVTLRDRQCWLAENLDYQTNQSIRLPQKPGSYYRGNAVDDVAPIGWRVATTEDWERLFKAYGERLDELQKDGLNIEFIGALHGNGTPGVWSDRGIFWTATIWHPNIVEKVFGSHKKREMVEFFEHGHFNVTCDNDIYLCPIRCVR